MTNPSINTNKPVNIHIFGNGNNVNIGNSEAPLNLISSNNTSGDNTASITKPVAKPAPNNDTKASLTAASSNNTYLPATSAQTNTQAYAQSNTQPYTQTYKSEITKTPSQIAASPASYNPVRVETRTNSNYDQYARLYEKYIGAYKTSYIPAYEKYLDTQKTVSRQTNYISPNTGYLHQAPVQYFRPSPQNYLNSSLTNSPQDLDYNTHSYAAESYHHNPKDYMYSDYVNFDLRNRRNKHNRFQNKFNQQNPQGTIDQIAYHLSSLASLINQLRGGRSTNKSNYSPKHRTPFGNELVHKLNSLLNNGNNYNSTDFNYFNTSANSPYSNFLTNDSGFASNILRRNNQSAKYDFRGAQGFNNIERGDSNSLAILDAESSGNFINLGNGSSKVDYKNSPGTQDTFLFGGRGQNDTFSISGLTLKDTLAALSKDYIFVKRNNGFSLINKNTGGEVRALGFERLEFKDAILDLTTPEGMQALEEGLNDANVEIIDLSNSLNNSQNNSQFDSQWSNNSNYLAPSGLARNFGTGNDYGDNSWNDFSDSTYASNPYSNLATDSGYSSGLDPNHGSAFESSPYSGSRLDSPYSSLNIPELSNYGGYSNYSLGELIGNQNSFYPQYSNSNQVIPPSAPIAPYYSESYDSNSEYAPPIVIVDTPIIVDPVDQNPNTDTNTISLSGTGQNNIVTRNNQPGAPLIINTQPNTAAIINNLFAPANATLASGFNGYIGSSQTQIRGSNTSGDPINGIFHSFGTFGAPTDNSAGTAPIDIDLGARSNGIPHRIIAVAGAGNINMRGGDLALLSSRSGGAENPGFTIQDARSVRIGGQLIQQTNDAASRQNIYVDERNQVYRINQDAQVIFVPRDRVNFENTNNNVGIGNPGGINNQIDANNFVNQSGQLPHITIVVTDGKTLDLAELLPFRPDQAPPVQSQNQPTPRDGQGTATGLNATPAAPAPQFQPQLQNRALVLA